MAERAGLRVAIGSQGSAALLRATAVAGTGAPLEVEVVSPIHKAFAPMVRETAYGVCELAIVTALQALEAGRPIAVLPAVVAARHQRGCLVTRADTAYDDPFSLRGKRIGVRAYTQTTGMWVRAHLAEDFGLSAADFTWVTKDTAHVAEYHDPQFVRRELDGSVVEALRNGEVDAAILGNDLPEGEFRPVFPDPAERDAQWSRQHGYVPVNHVLVASTDALAGDAETVRMVYRTLRDDANEHAEGVVTPLFGVTDLTTPIEEIVATCVSQGLLARPIPATDVLASATRLLGEE